jgi:hypothetical protein
LCAMLFCLYFSTKKKYSEEIVWTCRPDDGPSRWPRSVRHELSSLDRSLESWVRILLKAGMSVCAFNLCLYCCMCMYRPCYGLIPVQGVLPTV